MATDRANRYLDVGFSEESDHDAGYDSEAAEISKAGRPSKRQKIETSDTDEDKDEDEDDEIDVEESGSVRKIIPTEPAPGLVEEPKLQSESEEEAKVEDDGEENDKGFSETGDISTLLKVRSPSSLRAKSSTITKKRPKDKQERTPGVIYLSSLPPYLKPSALRNILEQRGFGPIARIFLSPASKSNKAHSSGGKNSRQLYTEGWIEFSSKKTARRCAETLNASTVGGKKGGYYRDDVWNMKYLSGMRWEELMAGVREEKREMEGRRDEERRVIARETKVFVEGVEEGRKQEGMKRKRERKRDDVVNGDDRTSEQTRADVRFTWRQNEVKGKTKPQDNGGSKISDDVALVLGKIF